MLYLNSSLQRAGLDTAQSVPNQSGFEKKSYCRTGIKYVVMAMTGLLLGSPTWATQPSNAVQSSVHIQQNQQIITLASALQKAQQYQMQQGIWQAQQDIDYANIQQSQLWQNPVFSINQTGFGQNQQRELNIGVSQKLDVFGERQARHRFAELIQQQTSLKQQRYQAQLELILKHLWAQLDIATLEAHFLQQQVQINERLLYVAQKRYQAGAIAQIDVERMQMTLLEEQRALHLAQWQTKLAQQALAQTWGAQAQDQEFEKGSKQENSIAFLHFPTWSAEILAAYQQKNFDQQERRLIQQQRNAELEIFKAQAKPNPTVSLGVKNTQSPNESQQNQLALGVEIPLVIFDRQQYRRQITQHKQQALYQQQRHDQQNNQLEIDKRVQRLHVLAEQFAQIESSQYPLSEKIQQKTLLGFEAGKLSMTDVQQSALQHQQIRFRTVQILRDAWRSVIEAESLSLGISPDQITAENALAQINQTLWQDTQNMTVIGAD